MSPSRLLLAALSFTLPLVGCDGKTDDTADSGGDDTNESVDPGDPPELVINEILAANVTVNTDDLGEFDDWVEIYNPSTETADLSEVYLTDDVANPTAYAFPGGTTIAPGGFLLVWCDDATGAEGFHAPFKLDKAGDEVALHYVHGANDPLRLDWVQFGKLADDLSAARVPDGSDTWVNTATPTPEASNGT